MTFSLGEHLYVGFRSVSQLRPKTRRKKETNGVFSERENEPTKSTNFFLRTVRRETMRTLGRIIDMSEVAIDY